MCAPPVLNVYKQKSPTLGEALLKSEAFHFDFPLSG